jgi:hypothetical protein
MPTLFPSSGEEEPNVVDHLDWAILSLIITETLN